MEGDGKKVEALRKECGCTENEARNALLLSRGCLDGARSVLAGRRRKETRYAGGVSGQVLEVPESSKGSVLEKLIKRSEENKEGGGGAVGTLGFVVYRNGVLVGEKFHRMAPAERDAMLEKITRTGEVPSELFGIKEGDLVDVEFRMETEEDYREQFPGKAYIVSGSQTEREPARAKQGGGRAREVGDEIRLGEGGPVFKLLLSGRRVRVAMGQGSRMGELLDFLRERGVCSSATKLRCQEKEVLEGEDSELYDKSMLTLQ